MTTDNSSGLFAHLPNKFQGNISPDITLVYIFQTLSSSQQHGWLSLRHEDHEIHEITLVFKGDQVAIASGADAKLNSILDRLLYAQQIDETAAAQIKATSEEQKVKLWVCMEQMLEQHELSHVLLAMKHTFCYEEICNLFNWTNCYYEFVSINDPEANHELIPFSPFYEVEGILLEVAQRQQEGIELQRILPAPIEIFEQGPEPKMPPNSTDNSILHVWNLANSQRIEQILAFSFLNEFDTKRILVALLQKGHVRLMQDDALKQKINSFKAQEKMQDALPYAELLFQHNPIDPENIQLLADCYQASGKNQALQQLYYNLAQRFLDSQNLDEKLFGAFYLKRFCDVDVDNTNDLQIDARFHLFQMVLQGELDGKAIDFNILTEGKKLFQLLRTRKNDAEARKILECLLHLYPHDKYLHSQYINVCLDLQDIPTAVAEYETMSKIYERDKNWQELIATYQKIIRLTPNRRDIQKKLDAVTSRLYKKPSKLKYVAIAFVVILLAPASWFVYDQYFVSPTNNDTPPPPVNSNNPPGDNSHQQLQHQISQLQQQIDQDVSEKLTRARQEMEKKQWESAQKILHDALARAPSTPLQDEINIELQKIKEMIQEQERIIQQFDQILSQAKEYEQKKQWREAINIYLGLSKNSKFTHLPQHSQIRLPIYCKVQPYKIQITVDQEPPFKFDHGEGIISCSPNFKKIVFEHEGYATYTLENPFENFNLYNSTTEKNKISSEGILQIVLDKAIVWDVELKKMASSTPAYLNNVLYVPLANGQMLLFQNINSNHSPQLIHEKSWGINQLPYNPCHHKGILYVPEKLQINIWDIQKKVVAGNSLKLGSRSEITSDPVLLKDLEILVFPTKDNSIYFQPVFNENTNSWPKANIVYLRSKAVSLPLVVVGHKIITTNTEGVVACYDARSQTKLWEVALRKVARCSPLVVGNVAYLPIGTTLIAIDIDRGQVLRQISFAGEGVSTPVYKDEVLYFITTKMIYAINLNFKMLWQKESPAGNLISSKIPPAMSNNNILYFCSQAITQQQDDKKIRVAYFYALDIKRQGELLWKYEFPDEPASSPLLLGDLIIQPVNKLYAFFDN